MCRGDVIRELIRESYELVAGSLPRRVREALDVKK